ncbi:FAD-dependent oxidoreductase [bacterium]|nr:FAD-dependent oxidoreductase [bacterium]MBP9806864.1 FAD-dependent oxidoreductase [bacterium]
MANLGEAKLAGKVALEVGEQIAPKVTAEGLNLLSVAGAKIEAAAKAVVSPELRAGAHVGPKNGMIEIHTSIDPRIVKAREIEAAGRTPYARPNLAEFPQLHATQKTDTLVIGGGFTGLSVADKLAASGIKTILVDSGRIGESTSQYAGGMITRAGDPGFVELSEAYGEKVLGQYAKGMVNAHKAVMERATQFGKKVDFKPSDSHQLSYNLDAVDDWMRAEHQAVARYDNGIRIVTGKQAKAIFEPAEAVMTFRGEGQLNPLKYAKQMGAEAKHPIFENTSIVGLQVGKPGGPITALTADGGRIEANRVVFATGTGGNLFRNLDHCVEGAQCFAGIAETKGVVKLLGNAFDTDGAVRNAAGIIRNRNTEGAYNYFRKPADALSVPGAEDKHLMLFGGADKMLGERAATKTAAELNEQLQTLFPGSKMLHKWTGLLEESKDGMPIIAQHKEVPQIFGIRGVGGSGIDSSQFIANELEKVIKGGKSVLSSARFEK